MPYIFPSVGNIGYSISSGSNERRGYIPCGAGKRREIREDRPIAVSLLSLGNVLSGADFTEELSVSTDQFTSIEPLLIRRCGRQKDGKGRYLSWHTSHLT